MIRSRYYFNYLQKKYELLLIALIFYLFLSPVYWLPGISHIFIKYFKITFILFIIIYYFLSSKGKFQIHNLLTIPIWTTILFLIPFLLNSNNVGSIFDVLIFYSNYFIGFLVSIIAYNSYNFIASDVKKFKLLFIGISLITIFPICNFFYGTPNVVSPLAVEMGTESLDVFWSTGFHGSRTGWCISLSAFIPFAVLFLNQFEGKRYNSKRLIYL